MTLKLRKKYLYILGIILLILIPSLFIWISSDPNFIEYEEIQMKPSMDIADNIQYSSTTSKFGMLITSVGYDTFLHDKGPYTVFVPTDEAYAKLSPGFLASIQLPEQEGDLRQTLLYHVVKGQYLFADLKDGMELTTVQGEKIKFTKKGEYWILNDYSYLENYDIKSKNGVIHTINNFLTPRTY